MKHAHENKTVHDLSQATCEIMILSNYEIKKMKRLEENTIKNVIILAKQCVSTPLYGALKPH